MTEAQFQFWQRVQRRAASEMPDVSAKLLKAFQLLRDSLTDRELLQLVQDRLGFEGLVTEVLSDQTLDRIFLPVQAQLQTVTQRAMTYFAKSLPGGGMIDGTLAVTFNVLSPTVIDAIRQLDTKVIQTLKDDARETVRQVVEDGLRAGVSPSTTARTLRDVLGLSPTQAQYVQNLRQELESGDLSVLQRQLRDKRFDRMLQKAFGPDGKGLTAKQIDTMVESYRKRWIAYNAEVNARTATMDAFRAAQRLAWDRAIEQGIVPEAKLMHQWIGVNDDRERPAHIAMNNEIQPFRQPYSNGQLIPGETDYNCRCLDRFFIAK